MKNENPPAFPCKGSIKAKQFVKYGNNLPELQDTYLPCDYQGMTLRDYFAGQALHFVDCDLKDASEMANHCYKIADAMLTERTKQCQ